MITTEDLIVEYLERLKDPELKQDKFDELIEKIKKLKALDLK